MNFNILYIVIQYNEEIQAVFDHEWSTYEILFINIDYCHHIMIMHFVLY